MDVLVKEPLTGGLDQLLDPEGLTEHGRNDTKQLEVPLVVPFFKKGKVDVHRPDGIAALTGDRNTNECRFRGASFGAPSGSVQEGWLLTDARHHDWTTSLDNATRDPFTRSPGRTASLGCQALGCFDL